MRNQCTEIVLDSNSILKNQLARSLGLDKYSQIMQESSISEKFQRVFNGYYQVRRKKGWREKYYSLFEEAREKKYSFDQILKRLYELTHRVEASFSSKMLATIDASMPILDSHVLHYFGLKIEGRRPEEKMKQAVAVYNQIEGLYREYLKTDEAEKAIEGFNRMLPNYSWINATKKIDYLIWSKR